MKAVLLKCETGLMYMFRRRRTNLAKRLWKARISSAPNKNETVCETKNAMIFDDEPNTCYCCAKSTVMSSGATSAGSDDALPYYESLLRHSVIKRLKDDELEMLVDVVESGGVNMSPCILVSSETIPNAHFVCCQLWRWPDVLEPLELKKIPNCDSFSSNECTESNCSSSNVSSPPSPTSLSPPPPSNLFICCNPYHWSRRCKKSDSPPPPYRRFSNERLKPEDKAPSESDIICDHISRQIELSGSLTTSGEGDGRAGEWCKLAYWELSQRVGRLYPVVHPYINVFWNQPFGDGLCLETLAQSSNIQLVPDSVKRTRKKIGLGLTLSLEEDGVWAYNRSEAPVFVNSPGLDDPHATTLLVYRIPTGHCLNIFDPSLPPRLRTDSQALTPTGPVDPNSIRISFAKGWGPKYSRQDITSCPTWIEVLLIPSAC